MTHHFNVFTVILSVSFTLCGVFSPITTNHSFLKTTQPPFTHWRMESSARRRLPHCFLFAITACCFIYIIYIRLIPVFVGLNNHFSMWTFQEVTPPLHLSARCLLFPTSLKAFPSSKGSVNQDSRLRLLLLFFISPRLSFATALRATPNLRLGRGFFPNYLRKVSFYSTGSCSVGRRC